MICTGCQNINGEVCSNTEISDFNRLTDRYFVGETLQFLSAQVRKTVWRYHE